LKWKWKKDLKKNLHKMSRLGQPLHNDTEFLHIPDNNSNLEYGMKEAKKAEVKGE
jgi:hypothetical protein